MGNALYDIANATHQAAISRRDALDRTIEGIEGGTLDPIWVRVPVYVGNRRDIDSTAQAQVGNLADRPGDATRPAQPVDAPPAGDPLASTVDLFYESRTPITPSGPVSESASPWPSRDRPRGWWRRGTRCSLSLGSLVGFVTVLGIAAHNGIILVSHYRHLETREGEPCPIGNRASGPLTPDDGCASEGRQQA